MILGYRIQFYLQILYTEAFNNFILLSPAPGISITGVSSMHGG